MKTKLSVLLLYLCSLTLFAACTCRKRRNSYPELLETEVSGRNDPEIRKRD